MANKGTPLEREIARDLSLWWSGGKDSDLFWRSSQSGGRATVRSRKGLKTRGHCGDISATDRVGEPLTKLFTIEVKRGYSRATIADLLDPAKVGQQTYDKWIEQARAAAGRAGTRYWMIIHRRDKRPKTVFIPTHLYNLLVNGLKCVYDLPLLSLNARLKSGKVVKVTGVSLQAFFDGTSPAALKSILKGGVRTGTDPDEVKNKTSLSLAQRILKVLGQSPIPMRAMDIGLIAAADMPHFFQQTWKVLLSLENSGLVERIRYVEGGKNKTKWRLKP